MADSRADLKDVEDLFERRRACWVHTQALAEALPDPAPSRKIKHTCPANLDRCSFKDMRVEVEDVDAIECGLALLYQGCNPIVLNLADPSYPGGLVEAGAATQEESIFRTTNLCRTLRLLPHLYPIRDGEAIISPQVRVLKTAEASGWQLLRGPPRYLDIVTCPGIVNPKLNSGKLSETDTKIYREKVETILQIAVDNGNDSVVLGALGCGAFRGPAISIAQIFKQVLATSFHGAFHQVTFAILQKQEGSPRGNNATFPNLQSFQQAFEHKESS